MYKNKPNTDKATRGTLKYATPYLTPPTPKAVAETNPVPLGKPALPPTDPTTGTLP